MCIECQKPCDGKEILNASCVEAWDRMLLKVILNLSMNCNMREMRETWNDEKEIQETSSGVTWDRMLLKVILTCPCTVISLKK